MTTLRTACNRDCPDACEILATVQDGRVTRLQGASDHPVTQGFLCHRTSRFLDRQYAAERLTTPLIRIGDCLEPTTWDVALDRIAGTFLRARDESGSASILNYRCGGSLGLMKHVTDHFFRQLGPLTEKTGDVCSGAGEAAQITDFGTCNSSDLFDLHHSRTLVLWGKNPYVSNVHLLPILRAAKARGATLILIDPVQHKTAQLCDLTVRPRAGGDAALACGIAKWLYDNNRHDAAAPNYCDHWDAYVALIQSHTLDKWAKAADIGVAELTAVAAAYAEGPAAILVGWGMQRRQHGAATVRAIDALTAMSGNLGIVGGGASFYFQRRAAFDLSFSANDPMPARTIPEPLLGEGILAAQDPPIRCVWISAANPVVMLPNSQQVAAALRTREMTVVVDSFLTDTAQCAHVVLPTTTFLEEDDLVGAYGHHYLANQRAVVPPLPGTKTDYQILQELAPRFGWPDRFREDVATWKRRLLGNVSSAGVSLESLEQRAQRNPFAPTVLFQGRQFPTASGRVNLLTSLDRALTQPASEHDGLRLTAVSTARAQGSQWTAAQQQTCATARIHPAAATGYEDGQIVELISSVGRLRVALTFDTQVHPALIVMDKGGWLQAGNCANALIPAQLTDAGEGAVYYDTPVTLAPV